MGGRACRGSFSRDGKGATTRSERSSSGVIDYVIKPAVTEVLVAKLKKGAREARRRRDGRRGAFRDRSPRCRSPISSRSSGTVASRARCAFGAASESGEVHFVEGMVVNAMWGKLRGEEAFYAMLRDFGR